MKLNVGCGDKHLEGWVNIDHAPEVQPDIVADAEHLPFDDEVAEVVFASHVLEHLPVQSEAIREWHRVLKPGGVIVVAVPDMLDEFFLVSHGVHNLEQFNGAVFGAVAFGQGADPKQGTHLQAFMPGMLRERMLPFFPDAHAVQECEVRQRFWGEEMVMGTKVTVATEADNQYLRDMLLEAEAEKPGIIKELSRRVIEKQAHR